MSKTTHFGFNRVAEAEKARKVAGVFDSVAERYNLMNDLMSAGMHRLWKRFAVQASGAREGGRVLDIAGGTADLSALFVAQVGEEGEVWLTDINNSMLTIGRDRLLDCGAAVPIAQCDAEKLPFPGNYFDCVNVAFGLRNMTHKDLALKEMLRVLRPGGCVIVLEFSKVWKPLQRLYDAYSFNVIPSLGRMVTGNAEPYRYLVESIRQFPKPEAFSTMIRAAGFSRVGHRPYTGNIAAIHSGWKI